jgi:hypothetical protein
MKVDCSTSVSQETAVRQSRDCSQHLLLNWEFVAFAMSDCFWSDILCLNFLIHPVQNAAVKCIALLLHIWDIAGSVSIRRLGILCDESNHFIQFFRHIVGY